MARKSAAPTKTNSEIRDALRQHAQYELATRLGAIDEGVGRLHAAIGHESAAAEINDILQKLEALKKSLRPATREHRFQASDVHPDICSVCGKNQSYGVLHC
jgi:hypothetical protein